MTDNSRTDSQRPPVNTPFEPEGRTVVVTGGASGIGAALAEEFHLRGASTVVILDLNEERCRGVAERIHQRTARAAGDVVGMRLDVTDRDATTSVIDRIETDISEIDLWCANAGIATGGGVETDPEVWSAIWNINVMGHVHAASVLVPRWVQRGAGHLLTTASAAALITNLGDAPYSVTKHGALAFAEWVAITHGSQGVGVSCLCPQGVRTPLVFGSAADEFSDLPGGSEWEGAELEDSIAAKAVKDQRMLDPHDVARYAADALARGDFLITPHPEARDYAIKRTTDTDRWISGMRKLQAFLER
jgi:NAD(P)-dependent dehydrogenase (short-subunit alcohol dehydrogenase family)